MVDDAMRIHDPLFLGKNRLQISLDDLGILTGRKSEQIADPPYVCIHHNAAGDSERRPEDDIGRSKK